MKQSRHQYPLFSDLIEAQKKSVLSFFEKGILEEFELFSYVQGKNVAMIFHGSKFFLQKPLFSFEYLVESQKTYSVSLFIPVEFQASPRQSSDITDLQDINTGIIEGAIAAAKPPQASQSRGVARAQASQSIVQASPLPCIEEVSAAPLQNSRQHFASRLAPWIYCGEIPFMTERGNFLINGSARVLVNQIVRCPSVYFKVRIDQKNRRTYIGSFLSEYGSWLRLETDYKNRLWVRIDKSERFSIYALLRGLGFPESFLKYQLKYYSFLFASQDEHQRTNPGVIDTSTLTLGSAGVALPVHVSNTSLPSSQLTPHAAVQAIWKKCNPNRWNSLHGCYTFVYTKFFHPKKYSIGGVGRGRLNKRLIAHNQRTTYNRRPARGTPKINQLPTLTPEDIFMALDVLIRFHYGEGVLDDIDHLKNRRVRLPGELMQNQLRLALSRMTQASGEKLNQVVGAQPVQSHSPAVALLQSQTTERRGEDVFSVEAQPLQSSAEAHATGGRNWGEALSAGPNKETTFPQSNPIEEVPGKSHTPLPGRVSFASCIQTQVFSSTFKELFNTSQLSQYMDQTNPLAEITHKRRLSSLGPGGIAKDQAGVAVREIHPSHFGRICPIETPEGQNAGLVGSLATYCQLTHEGFLEAIYSPGKGSVSPIHELSAQSAPQTWVQPLQNRDYSVASVALRGRNGSAAGPCKATPAERALQSYKLSWSQPSPPHHKRSEWFVFQADTEDEVFISAEQYRSTAVSRGAAGELTIGSAGVGKAWASESKGGSLASPCSTKPPVQYTPIRYRQEFFRVDETLVEFFGVSPIQMISLATSLIPFLEHDDANRALMGSNMQRQAVPLMTTERAYVGTGLEVQAARDSTSLCCTQVSGQVALIDANHVALRGDTFFGGGQASQSGAQASQRGVQASQSGAQASPLQSQWEYDLQKYWRSNQNTCIYQKPNHHHGSWVEKGSCVADGAASAHGEIALGKNIFVAYMPWEGFNFEDAIVINQRLVDEDIYTSIHIERYDIDVMDTEYGKEILGRDLLNPREHSEAGRGGFGAAQAWDSSPQSRGVAAAKPSPIQGQNLSSTWAKPTSTLNLDARGIILPGTWVEEDDILVGKMTPIAPPKPTPEYRLLLAIFETKPLPFRDTSLRVPPGIQGRILECIVKYEQGVGKLGRGAASPSTEATLETGGLTIESVQVFLASKRKIQLGDKMSGRHGNKGIVSCILPPQDMPFVQDGSPLDIVLNPLGVPSRMNVGQVLECLFGFAAKTLCENYRLIPFDEIYGEEASRGLVYAKLFEASKITGYEWIFDPNHPGKTHIFDGRTGEAFHQPVLVGYSYMLKLIHQVDEKMHARSTGPYSLITQQPLGGRAKHGGQRLGEMEVWACEGFGASAVLHEFLTLKSDDIDSRNTFLFHVMKRKSLGNIDVGVSAGFASAKPLYAPQRRSLRSSGATGGGSVASPREAPSQLPMSAPPQALRRELRHPTLPTLVSQPTTVPESFRVLVHELQSLCLSVYFHPEFRLTYPSLLGWDGLFVLPSQSDRQ